MPTPLPSSDISRRALLDRREVLRRRRGYWRLRRGQDVLISLAVLGAGWPLLALIALAIVLDSPGAGPIFVQDRVGRDGKVFRIYKFRSMVPQAEAMLEGLLNQNEQDGPAFKIAADPRITRLGKFLRRSGLDELPQFLNVLRGDMSIVGPRPPLPREAEQYDDYQRQRLYVTPGISCYWQIQPNRNRLTFEEWMELDLKFITGSSFRGDWQIIGKTLTAMLAMNGE